MAHMSGNELNFWILIKKHGVEKSVPKKYKTACALGLKKVLCIFLSSFNIFRIIPFTVFFKLSMPIPYTRGHIQSPKKGYTPPDFLIYVLSCTSHTTKSMKRNDIPMEGPIKLQDEIKKKLNFPTIC